MPVMKGTWILERTQNDRFPYRLQIIREDKPWLVLHTQDRWPTVGRHIFCLREDEPPASDEILEELERVDIVAFNERGRRISVVLDRKIRKRCDFLFLKKSYKGRPGESYEQIFWLTQRSIEQHRPAFKLVSRQRSADMVIRIHSNEKYPWRFPGAITERGSLPSGDYALMNGDTMLAVVERKTMDNLLADFGIMPVLHQRLAELAAHNNHALVIEAPYADFLNPKKVHHYTPGFCAKAIAELYALHSNLRIVFCANRKVANEWARQFFTAVWNLRESGDS
ncbi:MAG: ERCC4 domain-containing protein [Dehalococcoidia bacterium]